MGLTLDDLHQIYARTDHYLAQAKVKTMKHTEITSSIQLAARLTDALYRESIVNADSAQALFDVLADALNKRPDIVAAVSEDLAERQREKDEYLADVMKRLDDLEQDYLRAYHATITSIEGGSNED